MGARSRAMTVAELIIVIAIIVVLAGLAYPVFARAKKSAQEAHCISNMKQYSIAIMLYREEAGSGVAYGKPAEMGLPTGTSTSFFNEQHRPCRGQDPASCGLPGGFVVRWPTGIPAAYYDPAADESWAKYVRKHEDRAVILADVNHPLGCPVSEYSTGRALGLRLDGSAKFRVRFGNPATTAGWWHDE